MPITSKNVVPPKKSLQTPKGIYTAPKQVVNAQDIPHVVVKKKKNSGMQQVMNSYSCRMKVNRG